MLKEKTFWADTEFFGLLGNPVRKSLSPAMHNANFQALGMNAVYTPYEVTESTVGTVIPALEALRFRGLNITMPLKQKIIQYLDELDEIAPAYAISIHKSQGSEYPVVVIPIMMQHYMLLQRNLVYTGATRGKKLVILVGESRALHMVVKNNKTRKRYTRLAERLRPPC